MVCYLTVIDLYNFQNFLLRVASHPILSFDQLFIGFLQLDEGWRDSIKDTGKTLEIFGNLGMIILILCLKVKWSRYRLSVAQRVGRGIALLFHDQATRRSEWSAARPGRTLPPGKTRYPLYRRLGGSQGWSGRAENLVPTGIRSWTVQPVAPSLYRLSYLAHKSK